MSLVSALSKLLIKMGGTPATGDNSDELVDKIADAYSGSSGGILFVDLSSEQDDQKTIYTCNKTAKEMYDGMETGIVIVKKQRVSHGMLVSGYTMIDMNGVGPDAGPFVFYIDGNEFSATTENDYPIYIDNGQS